MALEGGEPARALVVGLIEQISALGLEVDELKRVAGWIPEPSMAPSLDPPKSRAQRRREVRERAKKLPGRGSDGQPSHEGKAREMAAPERVDDRYDTRIRRRSARAALLASMAAKGRLGDPLIRQKWESPTIAQLNIEHRLYRLACPECGKCALAQLPAFRPRLEADVAMLVGVFCLSPARSTSLCAVDRTIMRMSSALADPGRSSATPFAGELAPWWCPEVAGAGRPRAGGLPRVDPRASRRPPRNWSTRTWAVLWPPIATPAITSSPSSSNNFAGATPSGHWSVGGAAR